MPRGIFPTGKRKRKGKRKKRGVKKDPLLGSQTKKKGRIRRRKKKKKTE